MAKLKSICPHCHALVPKGQRCGCRPRFPQMTEAQRMQANPRRRGYQGAGYRTSRAVAIARATDAAGVIHCERCGMVVGIRHDARGRVTDYQTHHRDGDPTNNPLDGSNLAVLCEGQGTNRCHETAEAELRRSRRL